MMMDMKEDSQTARLSGPDQFSPEYIAYILSDEAKGLQEGHFLEVGEWRIFNPIFGIDRPWLVTDSGEGYGLTAQGIHADGSPVACMYARERSKWLPTLWHLLQIIERAGYWWRQRLAWDGDKRYEMGIGKLPGHGHAWDVAENDLMLAAAKLAARAIATRRQR